MTNLPNQPDPRPTVRSAQPATRRNLNVPNAGTDPANSINSYRPPNSNKPLIITIVVLVLVAVVALVGVQLMNKNNKDSSPTGGSESPTSQPTYHDPCETYQYCAVVYDTRVDAEGLWVINDYTWTGTNLSIDMTVTSTKGQLYYSFNAIDHTNSANYYSPDIKFGAGNLDSGSLDEGESISGKVYFTVKRGKLNIIINGYRGIQAAMITIE